MGECTDIDDQYQEKDTSSHCQVSEIKEVSNEVLCRTPPAVISLERVSSLRKSTGFVILFLVLETNKQVNNFALSRNNNGRYPVPMSLVVVLAEALKMIFVFFWAKVSGIKIETWTSSMRFALPAIFYCLTNLLYLSSITVISPPIWLVLIQTRTLYIAAAYKIIFGKKVTIIQGLGCLLIVCSIAVTKLSSLKDDQTPTLTVGIILISQLSAILSTGASLCVELLLKNDTRCFCEQQWWLYVWGTLVGSSVMLIVEDTQILFGDIKNIFDNNQQLVQLSVAIFSTSLAGLSIPFILKNLDTIVKDYLSASNNLVLSLVTFVLFPGALSLNWQYFLALAILVLGIWMYENKALGKT